MAGCERFKINLSVIIGYPAIAGNSRHVCGNKICTGSEPQTDVKQMLRCKHANHVQI